MKSTSNRLAAGRQKYGLARYLRREARNQINRLFFRLDRKRLAAAFESIGAAGDKTVCVHSSLSRLGYIDGGADTVVDALFDCLGKYGCIVMPAFSMDGTMVSYLSKGSVFDVRTTPARVGAIAEAFRRRDGVVRSLHPTNSVMAFGKGAQELVSGHEASPTPYGYSTPYGKLVENEKAYILMLDTHVQSLLHHIQERVDFPNLFLEGETCVELVDYDGVKRQMTTKVMRPLIPYFVALPSPAGAEPAWVTLHDFALLYPPRRDAFVAETLGYHPETVRVLQDRRRRLIEDGVLKSQRLGRAEIGLLHVARFVRAVQPEFEASIAKFRSFYDVAYLEGKALRLA